LKVAPRAPLKAVHTVSVCPVAVFVVLLGEEEAAVELGEVLVVEGVLELQAAASRDKPTVAASRPRRERERAMGMSSLLGSRAGQTLVPERGGLLAVS
jgi:hypothetical protein